MNLCQNTRMSLNEGFEPVFKENREIIAEGTYANVYLLSAGTHGATVRCVKEVDFLKLAVARDKDDTKRRFEHEAEALIVLASRAPHRFVNVERIIRDTRGVCTGIVMEYLEGKRLFEMMQCGPLNTLEATKIAVQILEGLIIMHDLGYIYGDLSEKNIIVTNGNVEMFDFGIIQSDRPGITLLKEPYVLGTPYTVAPEAIKYGLISPAIDIYAVGVILYKMLSGKHPFDPFGQFDHDDDLNGFFNAMINSPLPPLERNIPLILSEITQRCLQKDPTARYPDARSAARDLADFVVSQDPRLRLEDPYYSILGRITG